MMMIPTLVEESCNLYMGLPKLTSFVFTLLWLLYLLQRED
jgi:hypothetical protein